MKKQTFKNKAVHLMAVAVLTTSAVSGISLMNNNQVVSAAKTSTSQIKLDEKAAVKKFNKKYANIKVDEIQLEKKGTKYVYEISGFDDQKEYSADVNAKTGKLTRAHSEKLDDNENNTALDLSKTITRKQANKIAEKAAKKGQGQSWTLETDNGKAVWDVEVVNGHKTTEVKVNAIDKSVISTQVDD